MNQGYDMIQIQRPNVSRHSDDGLRNQGLGGFQAFTPSIQEWVRNLSILSAWKSIYKPKEATAILCSYPSVLPNDCAAIK